MNLILVDLEATCWPPGDPRRKQQSEISESIEIYGAAVDPINFSILKDFHSYVRPNNNPILTDFCKKLTGLSQAMIDVAPSSEDFIKTWQSWVGKAPFYLASWGSFDHRVLSREWTKYTRTEATWMHVDIQKKFELCCRAHRAEKTAWYQSRKSARISGLSLNEALDSIGYLRQGQAHTAQSDTLGALACLKFACSAQGLTPLEQSLMQMVKQETKQNRAVYWGEAIRSLGLSRASYATMSRNLAKRGFVHFEAKLGALRLSL